MIRLKDCLTSIEHRIKQVLPEVKGQGGEVRERRGLYGKLKDTMRRFVWFLDKVDVIRGELARWISTEERMKHFQDSIVQLVLQDPHQIALNGRPGIRYPVHSKLDAIFSAQLEL